MRPFSLSFCFFLIFFAMHAQNDGTSEIKHTIDTFFEGFHQQDSVKIRKAVVGNVIMQTIGKDKTGNPILKTEDFSHFLKSIVSIPKDQKFEEKLLDYHIQIDGTMAHAWTPYEFWFNGNFSHCGVNSFQLFKTADGWKIIYIIDTRRKEGCGL